MNDKSLAEEGQDDPSLQAQSRANQPPCPGKETHLAQEDHSLTEVHAHTDDRMSLRSALLLASAFGAVNFLIHFFASLWGSHLGYGFYRDEFYYLVCGHHLAWGYVDHPPLVALQARLAEILFGVSPTGVRILSFLAGSITIGLTGLLTWQLGGKRNAQMLAMTALMSGPLFLGVTNFLSMNAFEPCFWMGALFIVLRVAEGSAKPHAWLLFGLLAGLGIENKHSTVFFLIALLLGLLLSPQRRILLSGFCLAGVGIVIVIALPNLLWQWNNHFPTYQFLHRVQQSDKTVRLSVPLFLYDQVKVLLYSTCPLWIGGIIWFAFSPKARNWRFVAFLYLIFLGMMIGMQAKYYYLAPIYPVLFAAGAVAFADIVKRPRWVNTYTVVLALSMVFTAPITLTILPPDRYNALTGIFTPDSVRMEKYTSPLPEVLSDRFGWPEMVQGFAARYNALPPEIRSGTAIFCHDYGEAGAVDILGPRYGLPAAISGHESFYFWGWNGYTGDSVLTLGNNRDEFTKDYAEVIDLGAFDPAWAMDRLHEHYFWLRHRKQPFAADWEQLKFWF